MAKQVITILKKAKQGLLHKKQKNGGMKYGWQIFSKFNKCKE
jgi:hypothetical protein